MAIPSSLNAASPVPVVVICCLVSGQQFTGVIVGVGVGVAVAVAVGVAVGVGVGVAVGVAVGVPVISG